MFEDHCNVSAYVSVPKVIFLQVADFTDTGSSKARFLAKNQHFQWKSLYYFVTIDSL